MDPLNQYLAWGFGLLVTTGLGILVRMNYRQGDKLDTHGRTLVEVRTTLVGASGNNGLVSEVNRLRDNFHEFRNAQQQKELAEKDRLLSEAQEENRRLRESRESAASN